MERIDAIIEFLETLDDEETRDMWNEFQRAYRYEDEVFTVAEVENDFLGDLTFREALEAIDKDEFDLDDDWAVNTIYGWKTFSDLFDVVDLGELARYIENEEEFFGYPELEELFEEEDEEDEEE